MLEIILLSTIFIIILIFGIKIEIKGLKFEIFGLKKHLFKSKYSRLRKYVKNNTYSIDDVWLVADGCNSPLRAMQMVQHRNLKKLHRLLNTN